MVFFLTRGADWLRQDADPTPSPSQHAGKGISGRGFGFMGRTAVRPHERSRASTPRHLPWLAGEGRDGVYVLPTLLINYGIVGFRAAIMPFTFTNPPAAQADLQVCFWVG
ncbi:hypothetical protein ADN00_01505 [Ornatilinea apprima]|uniref:Uncharacterized protein n=1 Tax=Ornatilinea apprima TaxID=1134406 RepID=A0A0P6XK52_9CHLR|nr:hypothetical protein ADN00_01505 [Ornatilinea apprima]